MYQLPSHHKLQKIFITSLKEGILQIMIKKFPHFLVLVVLVKSLSVRLKMSCSHGTQLFQNTMDSILKERKMGMGDMYILMVIYTKAHLLRIKGVELASCYGKMVEFTRDFGKMTRSRAKAFSKSHLLLTLLS
jgi:hypothetical protein